MVKKERCDTVVSKIPFYFGNPCMSLGDHLELDFEKKKLDFGQQNHIFVKFGNLKMDLFLLTGCIFETIKLICVSLLSIFLYYIDTHTTR